VAGEGGEVELEDAGVVVGGGGGRLEAAILAGLRIDYDRCAGLECGSVRLRSRHRRRRRAARVDLDDRGDAAGVADVVGAGERVEVAAGAGQVLADRRSEERRVGKSVDLGGRGSSEKKKGVEAVAVQPGAGVGRWGRR